MVMQLSKGSLGTLFFTLRKLRSEDFSVPTYVIMREYLFVTFILVGLTTSGVSLGLSFPFVFPRKSG
jgi:hypothetical protein